MARLKLIEYLNDPTLLEQISEEEMIQWAKEVPYAGLVQRLLAQKLAIENSKKALAEKATTMAILSNANPNQVIKSIADFKNLILSNEKKNETAEQHNSEILGQNDVNQDTKHPQQANVDTPLSEQQPETVEIVDEEVINQPTPKEEEIELQPSDDQLSLNTADEIQVNTLSTASSENEEISEFSEWLISLQSISENDEIERTEIELADKQLASDALAQLLVSQGHYAQAIAMYEILMLKIPQKSSFFADQIQKLKSL